MSEGLRKALLLLAALLAIALTARLGLWQLDRAAQKRERQAALDARAALPALQLQDLLAGTPSEQLLHREVRLRGHWLEQHTVFLDNRPMGQRVGFYVVTPLQLAGSDRQVLVQRGWLPRDLRDRTLLPALHSSAGEVQLRARVIAAPARLLELGEAGQGRIRQNLDPSGFARETGLALLPLALLQLEPEAAGAAVAQASAALLRDWPAPDSGLQKHYGYAFQWFALSALLTGLYVWFQLLRPRRRRGPQRA